MHEDTGEIKKLAEILKLPKDEQGKYIPIPKKELDAVIHMNRAQRRLWAKKNKHRSKWSSLNAAKP